MADEEQKPPRQAHVSFALKESEYKLLLRLRALKTQAGEDSFRLELELTTESISILNTKRIQREVYA